MSDRSEATMEDAGGVSQWRPRYYIPRSQVWPNSRGTRGRVHLQAVGAVELHSVDGRRARQIGRSSGQTLCGRPGGWMEREPESEDPKCPRCIELAAAYDVVWPDWEFAPTPTTEDQES